MQLIRKYIKETLLSEKVTREDIEDIEATARLAHLGQKRRDGLEYITHPMAVRDITKRHYPANHPAQLLSLLHDAIEDGPGLGNVTEQELRNFIKGSISDPQDFIDIEKALEYMTHDKSIYPVYEDYLSRVFENPLASIVKISDLIHNLSNNPSEQQVRKYSSALQNIQIPKNIKKSHLNELLTILRKYR